MSMAGWCVWGFLIIIMCPISAFLGFFELAYARSSGDALGTFLVWGGIPALILICAVLADNAQRESPQSARIFAYITSTIIGFLMPVALPQLARLKSLL